MSSIGSMRLLYLSFALCVSTILADQQCHPFYVRWPRVKLNFKAVTNARLNLRACESACSLGEDPLVPGRKLECAALNHHPSPDGFSHQCDVFQPHQLQNVDGYVEADDRFSFYWKYCVNSTQKCNGEYAFTYLSDRYMDSKEVMRTVTTGSLEDCLAECLDEISFPCRSISFNRTDGGCHLSVNSQLTKPGSVRLNNNPNFRIDYYENNCYNLSESFKFEQECREDGILVKVKSKFPYTGALYGLYDYFTCKIEPKELDNFEYLFPSPTLSKNCSDSIRFKGSEMILEVVLSTDGVEPLYFITPDDLTFQAKCPIQTQSKAKDIPHKPTLDRKTKAEKMEASAHALFSLLSNGEPKETTTKPSTTTTSTTTTTVSGTTTTTPSTTQPSTTSSSTSTSTTTESTTITTSGTTTTTPGSTDSTTTATTIGASHNNSTGTSTDTSTGTTETTNNTTTKHSSTTTTTRSPKTNPKKAKTFTIPSAKNDTTTSPDGTTATTKVQTTKTTSKAPTTTTTTSTSAPTTTAKTSTTTVKSTTQTTQKPTTVSTTKKTTTATETTTTTPSPAPAPSSDESDKTIHRKPAAPGTQSVVTKSVKTPVAFDIYRDGRPVEAVVVGSKITLSFTPHYPIPPEYMSIRGCQVEPIDPKYEWEKEPLPIIRDACPADLVGLVCPPQHSEYGIKVSVESFRYQTTPQVQYSCLVRVCPFAPCPTTRCASVEGCPNTDRIRRALSLEQIREALEQDPNLARQFGISPALLASRPAQTVEQQLVALGGDHVVKRRLVVVNSEDQLRYYVNTGDIP